MTDILRRLDELEAQLESISRELRSVRAAAFSSDPGRVSTRPAAPPPAPVPAAARTPSAPAPPAPAEPAPRSRPPAPPRREIDWNELLGPRALAWAGGALTVLGIVFFFALAVNRGWIGPEERVGLGALATAAVFGGGWWLRRRYGDTAASLAAVGASIAGAYATLLAATELYDLVPDVAGLVAAAAIAGAATATAVAWRSELIGGLGLIGAMAMPVLLTGADGLTLVAAAFTLLVLGGSLAVALWRGWRWLLFAALWVSFPQIAWLAADGDVSTIPLLALGLGFWLAYLSVPAVLQWAAEEDDLDRASVFFTLATVALAAFATTLFDGDAFGAALLAVAVVYGALAAATFRRRPYGELSHVCAAFALLFLGAGEERLLSNEPLTVAWAAQAAALAVLAWLVREPRYELGSLAFMVLATVHAVTIDTPPREALYEATRDPAEGAVAAVAIAVASTIVALVYRRLEELEVRVVGTLGRALEYGRELRRAVAVAAVSLGAVAGVYALSLGVLELAQAVGDDVASAWAWGRVAVNGLWALIAAAVVIVGLRRRVDTLAAGGVIALVLTAFSTVTFDLGQVDDTAASWSLLQVGVAMLLAGYAWLLMRAARPYENVAYGFVLASAAASALAAVRLTDDGGALLAVGAAYLLLSLPVFRSRRDLGTLCWGIGLAFTAAAAVILLDDTWLVLALAAASVVLAFLSPSVREWRLLLPAAAGAAGAGAHALALDSPPARFFDANDQPAGGVPALALALAAVAAFGWNARRSDAPVPAGALDRYERPYVIGFAAGVLYALSLCVLGLAEALGGASIETKFERGHTAVTAVWALVALALLYVGLRRGTRLRVLGLALFAVSVVKLFLYDLASLSSVARALAFLAVGALLMLGAFFYQRLAAS